MRELFFSSEFATGSLFRALCSWTVLASFTQAELPKPGVGNTISVRLDAERIVIGTVDERTNHNRLWLRHGEEGVTLWSGFKWPQVIAWKVIREPLAPPTKETELADQPFAFVTPPSSMNSTEQIPAPGPHESGQVPPYFSLPTSYDQRFGSQVDSVDVYAEIANWDGDVEPDGLRVFLRPRDAQGYAVPLTGHVRFKLLGQRPPALRHRPRLRHQRFSELAQWSRQVYPEDILHDGAVYLLEFRRFHPDVDLDVATEALLHARLSVPTQGVFEGSDANVYLRPFSRLRDDLQQQTGNRYFRQEHTRLRSSPF